MARSPVAGLALPRRSVPTALFKTWAIAVEHATSPSTSTQLALFYRHDYKAVLKTATLVANRSFTCPRYIPRL